jgi:hypothetical protein
MLPEQLQQGVKEHLKWPIRVAKMRNTGPSLDDRYVTVQLRRFYHSPAKARDTLGWVPPLSYERGLETLVAWLRFAGVGA